MGEIRNHSFFREIPPRPEDVEISGFDQEDLPNIEQSPSKDIPVPKEEKKQSRERSPMTIAMNASSVNLAVIEEEVNDETNKSHQSKLRNQHSTLQRSLSSGAKTQLDTN